jgi:AMP nucleosidase
MELGAGVFAAVGANVRSLVWEPVAPAITANGFGFRVPYGTLLCVSDKPLHGEIKLAGIAGEFYRQGVGQHSRSA